MRLHENFVHAQGFGAGAGVIMALESGDKHFHIYIAAVGLQGI